MMTAKTQDQDAEKTYRAIGRFIFEFSMVEFVIRFKLAEEIGLDKRHKAVVESYDVAKLCAVAEDVFTKSRAKENAAQISDLIHEFLTLNNIRNRVAHGLWQPQMEGGTVSHVSRCLTPKLFPHQAEKLEKEADKAKTLVSKLLQVFKNDEPK
jgi:hypothetical protein